MSDIGNYASGQRTYTTSEGSYTLNLDAYKVDQKDINELDALNSGDALGQGNLVRLMQKYQSIVLVTAGGRELDKPEDLLPESLDVDGMGRDFDGSAGFAEAMMMIAKAAQQQRQLQMERGDNARKSIIVSAKAELEKDLTAADASQKAAIIEGAVGIAAAGLGAVGGGVGLYKTGKAQVLASRAAKAESAQSKHDVGALKSQKGVDKAEAGRVEVARLNRDNDVALGDALKARNAKQLEVNLRGNAVTPTEKAKMLRDLDDMDVKVVDLKSKKKNLDRENTDLTRIGKERASVARDHEIAAAPKRLEAKGLHSEAETKLAWGRSMGVVFNSLSQAGNSTGRVAASTETYQAAVLQANAKMDGATKEAASVVQGQASDAASHMRDMLSEALNALRAVNDKAQDTLNRISSNMA